MKKIISIVLLLTLVLGLFAGCGKGDATEAGNPLDAAVAYLKNMYDKSTKNEVNKLTADKELLPAVTIDGVSYPVSWAIEITSGPAECIVMADGASAGTQKIKVAVQPEEEVRFDLVGTVSDANGKTATITIKFYSPAVQKVEVDEGQKVVIYQVSDAKYMTGIDYLYTSSSGSQKHELELTTEKAEALPLTLKTNDDGTVSFVTDGGLFLFCDATHVMFVEEESDFTKFILEAAEGGQYIKCAVANYNDKPQYLEVYSGYMTCYGMSETSMALYIFELQDAEGANGTIGEAAPVCEHDFVEGTCTKCGEADPNYVDPSTKAQLPEVTAPVAGTAYKFGMIQVNTGNTVYITGEVSGRYLATTTDKAAAADVYVENVDGGMMIYILVDGAKSYMTIYNNDEGKRSVGFSAEGTVFQFNAECGTWYTTFDGKECYVGSYNDFETVSVSDTSYIDASNAGIKQFPAGFFNAEGGNNGGETGDNGNTGDNGDNGDVTPSGVPFKDGDKIVIVCGAYGKALSTQPSSEGSYYQMGVDVTVKDGTVSGYADTEVWTVIANDDGTYSFSYNGQNLGMQDSFSSMSLGSVNDKWELIALENGTYALKNVVRGNYIEWYDAKNNWSTYTTEDLLGNDLFQLSFFVVG